MVQIVLLNATAVAIDTWKSFNILELLRALKFDMWFYTTLFVTKL